MNNEIFEHNIKCLMNAIVQKMERKDIITYGEEQEIQSIVEAIFYQSLDELLKENNKLQQELQRKDNIINMIIEQLYILRGLTFTKYKSNEWNNCLSWNDDIQPILDKIKELEEK